MAETVLLVRVEVHARAVDTVFEVADDSGNGAKMNATRNRIDLWIGNVIAIGDNVLGIGAGHQRNHEVSTAYYTQTSNDAKLRADTERRTDTEMDIQYGSHRLDGYGRMHNR